MKTLILIMMCVAVYAGELQLPPPVKAFVAQHFPKQKITRAVLDNELLGKTKYELRLDNAVEIDITPKGEWLDIDGNKNKIPDSVVPPPILKYAQDNGAGAYIKQIERKTYGYEIELSNGLEMKFDQKGNFLKLDH